MLVFGVIAALGWAASEMTSAYQVGETIPISLDPTELPYYALRTVFRMLIALVCSVLFTFIFGTWAAKSKQAERIIIPLIDILQSVPVLGFLSISVVFFIALFPGSLLGPECAAIFAIFTSQVWNMTLSFYQSCRTVPYDLREAAAMFQLTPWQSFWRLDVPFAMPGLIWNAMMSMSASWFFVVASEAITAVNPSITLPGIGSYISHTLAAEDLHAVVYAIVAMFIVILVYDQLLFRPLNKWIDRFKFEEDDDFTETDTWLIGIFHRTRLVRKLSTMLTSLWDAFVMLPLFSKPRPPQIEVVFSPKQKLIHLLTSVLIFCISTAAMVVLVWFVAKRISLYEVMHVIYLGFITGVRVMVLIFLSSVVWVPVGVWVGLRPRWTQVMQPVIQFLAAFPAYLLYPLFVILIVRYQLNPDVWTSPLIILGTQWYILFNIIVGTMALPKSLKQVASNFQVTGWLWWKRLILPGIFPYYVTGAITAAGGAWNASIVAELITWGDKKIEATGIGAYITNSYDALDYPRLVLGITIMCLYVVIINRVFWRPLYNLAEQRYTIE